MGGRALQVGLTGGIGSGKSEVARRLARRGALLIDADQLAREVLAPGTPGLAEVVAAFGPDILAPDGTLDRPALARVVFGDDEARARLEAIVHPRVGVLSTERAEAAPPGTVVVHDVPLLVEGRLQARYDLVVVVDAPVEVQLHRLVTLRGMAEADARARIAAQASREQRRAAADFVLDNSGDLDALELQVDRVWQRLAAQAAAGPG